MTYDYLSYNVVINAAPETPRNGINASQSKHMKEL